MQTLKNLWPIVAVLAPVLGFTVVKAGWLRPSIGAYVVLGVLGVLTLVGVVYGIREGRRVSRNGQYIGR